MIKITNADCSICVKYKTEHCADRRCSNCMVDKIADPGCLGVEECRIARKEVFKKCSDFIIRDWDE